MTADRNVIIPQKSVFGQLHAPVVCLTSSVVVERLFLSVSTCLKWGSWNPRRKVFVSTKGELFALMGGGGWRGWSVSSLEVCRVRRSLCLELLSQSWWSLMSCWTTFFWRLGLRSEPDPDDAPDPKDRKRSLASFMKQPPGSLAHTWGEIKNYNLCTLDSQTSLKNYWYLFI